MAFFKFRFPGQDDQAHHNNDSHHESLEALRKRVKHRLIGSGVLVLIAVIGFPLVFDTQPRPVGLDIPIDIPDKAKTAVNVAPTPLKSDRRAAAQADKSSDQELPTQRASSSAASNSTAVAKASEAAKSASEPSASAPLSAPPSAPSSAPSSAPQASPASVAALAAPASNAAKSTEAKNTPVSARSTLDAKEEIVSSSKTQIASSKSSSETSSSAKEDRYIIQVGAYSDEQKVRDIREKLEKAGLHTYTQVIDKEGKKIRIRIGPFTSKEDANRQLQKVKSLNLQPSLLTL